MLYQIHLFYFFISVIIIIYIFFNIYREIEGIRLSRGHAHEEESIYINEVYEVSNGRGIGNEE